MAVGAHPDDIEFGAGGTLAGWAEQGCEAIFVVVTDGSKGTWHAGAHPALVAEQRRAEQDKAAAVLGAVQVVWLDWVDGELEYTMDLRSQLCRQIRLHRSAVVLTHDPWQRYQLHPDHRVTGMAVVDAVVAARDPLFFPQQGLPAHRPDALLLWSADEPDHAEDVAGSIDRKVEALLCHSSQSETTLGGAGENADARTRFDLGVRKWAAEAGAPFDIELAETFKLLAP